MCWPTAYGRIDVCFAASKLLIHGSSNCVRGRALPRNCRKNEVRLTNRMHHQLWRYYPQMLKLADDLAAGWLLELWTLAPTPSKARRLRKSTIERLLKQHGIRRMDAETALGILKEPAIKVADGVVKRPVFTCARSSLAYALSIVSCARPSINSMKSARSLARPAPHQEYAFNDKTS